MKVDQLKPKHIVTGSLLPEPVKIITLVKMGDSIKLIGEGMCTGKIHQPILTVEQIAELKVSPETEPFDGDAAKFRLGVEAMRLGLAYEYDPYFSLSIARVDPLPHQLEAVYDYFLRLPRIRFLLADDPGAGKTIMEGLLIKELKVRGLIQRILIVTPANLSFQWQRELKEKFRENFQVIRSDVLRSTYGANPWQDINQVITSISWVSRIEDAKESLMRSTWDLIIVDEAHKMSAYSEEKKTLAYQLGESLSEMTDHYLLMTATPHKGDPENFSLFLRLLDRDVYGDVKSLELAMEERTAPFYLRRVKEALVTFPDPDTGEVKSLFTKRIVHTAGFQIDDDELDFYDNLTHYVEDQSIKASQDDSARGRALGFTMAMLQRRFASSIYAVRRTMERMKAKREKILEDPEAYRQEQINKKVPDDFDELPEEEQQEILANLEDVVASIDPEDLREEIIELGKLVDQARSLEKREVETKLNKLRDVITEGGVFQDEKMKLLLFTEHKDTLDYLAGDGRDGRPLGKLREWGLNVTQIHGSMKVGDRDKPGTRICAEREFKEDCQVLVATEAAGEGINLQFCWYMINYDIPWNPNRLEQRMGRIHRYGQEKDCLITNFVSTNTREGRVLEKLFDRISQIEDDLDPNRTGKVFNVLGDVFPANQLERMLREMYARNLTEAVIKDRIVEQVDTERLKRITESTLEGLAKRELNLSAIVGKSEEAKERRLVPEVIEDFFIQASPLAGVSPKQDRKQEHIYRVGRLPRVLMPYGEQLEPKFGKLGREYKQIVFGKELLSTDPTLEWVTPGHPLFESVRAMVQDKVETDLQRGAVFYDLHRSTAALLNVFSGEIRDGRGHILHKRLLVSQTAQDGTSTVRQPTIFLDLSIAPKGTKVPDSASLPGRDHVETILYQQALLPILEEERVQREKEVKTISKHMEISMNAIIDRAQIQLGELVNQKESGSKEAGLDGRIKMLDDKLDELNNRLERRRSDLKKEQQCTISNIQHLGSAWVLPHPDRETPEVKRMVRDPEIEKLAVEAAIRYEESRGWRVQSVEQENRGFDLISRKPHPEDPETAYGDYDPSISSDGLTIYFESDRPGGNGSSDIWITTQITGRQMTELVWGTPINLGPVVNSSHEDWGANISADGLELYFCSDRPGGHGSYDLYLTTRDCVSEPWGPPMNLGLGVNSQYSEVSPNISSDGLSLFFSEYDSPGTTFRPGGQGQADIWVTTRASVSDPWGPPVNLGLEINTTQHESAPHISANGLSLFFDRGSYSVANIWLTKRNTQDDPWREAVNLGPTVNSPRWDGGAEISTDGLTLYFSSNRPGGLGRPDIWKVPIMPVIDLNDDGIVDSADMCIVVDYWGTDEPLCDIGPMPWGDGIVDVQDLIVLAEHLFEEYPPAEPVE